MNYGNRAVVDKEPPQPDYTKEPRSTWIKTTGRRDQVLYVAGNGNQNADVMFVMPSLLEEDSVEERYSSFSGDQKLKEVPAYCKGMCGGILKDLVDRSGMDATSAWYTSVVKWLLPRNKRTKPPREALVHATPSFMAEVKAIKPKLVVCMGKQAFDVFCPIKIKADDIKLGIMYHKELDLHYVLVDPMYLLGMRPDFVEKMAVELQEVAKFLSQVRGTAVPKIECNYQYLRTRKEVEDWVDNVASKFQLFAVDCEWGGENFVDGTLRTIQFSWLPGTGVAVVFRDETTAYTMDASYEEIGAILGRHMNHPDVKYVGHHVSADFVWMRHWLKLATYKKCVIDTEFAQQVLYEHVGLGLDNLALMYTDLGKYDLDLILWKKSNPLGLKEGYGKVPDSILLPYACQDTDATLRIALALHQKLKEDGTWDYYQNMFNPFVTDVFTEFCYNGLPVDVPMLDELRDLFLYARNKMEIRLKNSIFHEAKQLFARECIALREKGIPIERDTIVRWVQGLLSDSPATTINSIKQVLGVANYPTFLPFILHLQESHGFNIRSGKSMVRWLFEVKRLTPLKSTNAKNKG